ncbi:MAG TPA: type II 3-dehydroquinate dehydratase [Cryomorphaceae bacterium]|nr:type II 3-dehydroquinate dehydratase [Cryomorphaceae bacterium]
MSILIINGPNLNLLGKREPTLYGSQSFEEILSTLQGEFPDMDIAYQQCNTEGEIIDILHSASEKGIKGIAMNPAAFTHTSIAIADAVAAIDVPVVELHISNVYHREGFRQKSFVSKYAAGVISGFGVEGYRLALTYFLRP